MLHPNGFSADSFLPMNCEPDGKLALSWAEHGLENAPWELRLELISKSHQRWGYLSLFRVTDGRPIAVDVNVLTGKFSAALSKAVERACARLEAEVKSGADGREAQFHKVASGS